MTSELAPKGLVTWLSSIELFDGLGQEDLQEIAHRLIVAFVQGGTVLFRQGDIEPALHLIVNGRVRVSIARPSRAAETIGEYVDGDVVCDAAFLSGTTSATTTKALRDTHLLYLPAPAFEDLAACRPQLALSLIRRILRTVAEPGQKKRPSTKTIALVPHETGRVFDSFATRLADSLNQVGSTVRLNASTSGRSSASGVAGTFDAAELDRRLWDHGRRPRFVLYEADCHDSEWTRRCLHSADHVLVVASADADPACTAVERGVLATRERIISERSLILVHSNGIQSPKSTRRWLETRFIDSHHHVRLDVPGDFERLARILSGRAICVVLSGGGARGFAHIGVLHAMVEAGLPIDAIGGVSMGAVIAAQFASGATFEQMRRMNRMSWTTRRLFEFNMPLTALVPDRKLATMLKEMFGELQGEDLWVPFFCVSANLTRAEVMVHWDGPLAVWLRASVLVPILAPPVVHRGELLADGGLLNNLPVDVMRKFCDGRVIAVDAGVRHDLEVASEWRRHPTTRDLLWGRLRRGRSKRSYPTLFQIFWRTVTLSSAHSTELSKRAADFYLHPPVEPFPLMKWDAVDRIIETGYNYGREAVPGLKAALLS